jgi:hypothetical protein
MMKGSGFGVENEWGTIRVAAIEEIPLLHLWGRGTGERRWRGQPRNRAWKRHEKRSPTPAASGGR